MITENYEEHWVPKYLDYDYPLTEQQYRRFVKGFVADWEQRYETISVDGWHYIYRSGTWLEKFRYVKQKDCLYQELEKHIKSRNKMQQESSGLSIRPALLYIGFSQT